MAASGTGAPCLTLQRGYLGAAGAARAGVGNARDALRALSATPKKHKEGTKKAELRYKKRLLLRYSRPTGREKIGKPT